MRYLGKGERVVNLMGQGKVTDMRRVTHRSVSIFKQVRQAPNRHTLRLCSDKQFQRSSRFPICPFAHRHNDEVICKRYCLRFRIGVDPEVNRRSKGRFRMRGEFNYRCGR